MLLRTVEEFVREELMPLERPFLRHDFDTLLPLIEEKRRLAKRLGLWLPQISSITALRSRKSAFLCLCRPVTCAVASP